MTAAVIVEIGMAFALPQVEICIADHVGTNIRRKSVHMKSLGRRIKFARSSRMSLDLGTREP